MQLSGAATSFSRTDAALPAYRAVYVKVGGGRDARWSCREKSYRAAAATCGEGQSLGKERGLQRAECLQRLGSVLAQSNDILLDHF